MNTDGPSFEHRVIWSLIADAKAGSDASMQPRYLPISMCSNGFNQNMFLFVENESKLQITNIYDGGMGFGRRVEISALRKLLQMLQNGAPKWTQAEMMMIKEYYDSIHTEYV